MGDSLETTQQILEQSHLRDQFAKLPPPQQEFLRVRFPACKTNTQALQLMRRDGRDAPSLRTVSRWIHTDSNFKECYDTLQRGLVDIVKHVANDDLVKAITVATREALELLSMPWNTLDSAALVNAKRSLIEHFTETKGPSEGAPQKSVSIASLAKLKGE